MVSKRNYSSVLISLVIHAIVLGGMWLMRMGHLTDTPTVVIETIFSERRETEEVMQQLQDDNEVAEIPNVLAGSVVSTIIGGSGAPAANQTRIEQSETLQEPDVQLNASEVTLPAESILARDLGESEVSGQVGQVVEGYGPAMSILTRELIRLMREQRIHVVWLFDESESMQDDQKEIRDKFYKVYEELGIAQQQDQSLSRRRGDILVTSIYSFGKELHAHTPKPTADRNEVRASIDKIQVDESGIENTCQSVQLILDKHASQDRRARRKLVVILVSDESGEQEDGKKYVESVITKSQQFQTPIYVLGRVAVFGYPYARIRWKDPEFGLPHWLRINRGPETAYPETLQWDGLHVRWDAIASGFGPYEQVRMAKETGGIFFLLPSRETNLSGVGSQGQRTYDPLDMKEYQPLLQPRRIYEQQRNASKFRQSIWRVIVTLNPHVDKQLNIREHHYPIEPAKFQKEGFEEFQKALRAMQLLNGAVKILEDIQPLRAKEPSMRWRANYDLIYAQCLSYRVRLFQYLLAFDKHSRDMPKPQNEKNNVWHARRFNSELRVPDEEQFRRIKQAFKVPMEREEYLAKLEEQQEKAEKLYKLVLQEHPGTPWAVRARHELNEGFGMKFVEAFHDPRYRLVGTKIKLPNL